MPPKCQSFGLFLATSLVAAFCGLASGGQAETHPALRAAADELARIYREACSCWSYTALWQGT